MGRLMDRISRRISTTIKAFQKDCAFSPKLAVYRMCDDLSWRIGLKKMSAGFHGKKDRWILNYLKADLIPMIEQYQLDESCGVFTPNAPIWVCWWTGEESAHPLVKQCIASIRQNAGTHPVHLITRENISDYLAVPPHVLEKVQSGQVCIANFSDYIRFSLLAEYGGLWLDATIFCSAQIPEELFREPLFTCRSPEKDCRYISRYRWTSFCFGGYRNGLLFRFMRDALDLFWDKNGRSIDYLLVDYLIETAYSEIPAVRALLDAVPYNNLHRDDLQAAMNAALCAEAFDEVLKEDTIFYKLSWRETYSLTTPDGQDSIYAYFLKKEPENPVA